MARTSRIASKVPWIVAWLIVGCLVALVASAHAGEVPPAGAQELQQVFQRVAPSVVAIRAQGRDAMSASQTRIIEKGSGVLISEGGQVLTAAFVVHGMDEITVEGYLAKDGSSTANAARITLPDGSKVFAGSPTTWAVS